MKIKVAAILFICSVVHAEDITNRNGTVLHNVSVSRVEPDAIVVMMSNGISRIGIAELTDADRARFGLDTKKAADYQRAAQLQAAHAATFAAKRKQGKHVVAEIIQVVDGTGLLVTASIFNNDFGVVDSSWQNATILIVGHPAEKKLTDGSVLDMQLYPCGIYRYSNTLGASSTVSRYAVTPELAVQLESKP